MPGYSVEWRHKTPNPIAIVPTREPVMFANNSVSTKQQSETALPEPIIVTGSKNKPTPSMKWASAGQTKQTYTLHNKPTTYISISSNTKAAITTNTAIQQGDKNKPVFFTGDEQEDDYARKSLTDGILALGFPAATFLVMFAIALSVGETLASAPAYAVAIFILGCVAGLFFAVLAFINGFRAINEINGDPDTYSGKGDAILGMILGALAPIGIAVYLLIRYL